MAPTYACGAGVGYGPDPAGATPKLPAPFVGEGLALYQNGGVGDAWRATADFGEGDAETLRLRQITLTRTAADGGQVTLSAPAAEVDVRGGGLQLRGEVRGRFTWAPAAAPAVQETPRPPPPARRPR